MTLPARAGLAAPAIVAAITLAVWLVAGASWALGVIALGFGGIIAVHLRHLARLEAWADGPHDAPVPEGRGAWEAPLSALYRRVRARTAYQRDLKQLIDRFRRGAEAIPDGVVVLDAQYRIEWANPRAVAQLGLDPDGDRGQPIVNLVRIPEFHRYLAVGDFAGPIVVGSLRDRRTLSLQLVPFGVSESLLLSRDITEVEALSQIRRDFIANVSHELKTPLTVVRGFVETLQDLDLDTRQRARFLGLIQDQARSMQRLVDDLLTLSALESEQNPVVDASFAIVPLLLELSADAKGLSQGQHGIALDIGRAAEITGSRDEMRSAFANLVSNAVRHTPAGGEVGIRWRIAGDGRGVFSVTDTGIGIAAEHIPRLTERFYRVDRSRSRGTGGTGLGLAIVKHVLLRHQAELGIESRPGEGSTFRVTLPASRVRNLVDGGSGEAGGIEAAVASQPAGGAG